MQRFIEVNPEPATLQRQQEVVMQTESHSIQALLLAAGIRAKVQIDDWALPVIVMDSAQFRENRDWVETRFYPICQDESKTYLRARIQ